jgi:hypothetical protein
MTPLERSLQLALTFALLVRKESSEGEREGREPRGDESGGYGTRARKDFVGDVFLDACAKQSMAWI